MILNKNFMYKLIIHKTYLVESLIKKSFSSSSTINVNKKIEGIFPPICTSFINEEIAWDKLESNLQKWEKIPFTGYVIHGSNGEYPFLSHEEKVNLVKAVKSSVDKNKLIIAGAGCESYRETLKTCESMAQYGANYALIVTPNYYKNHMTEMALQNYFTKVADKSPIPLILYNMPVNTSIDMSAELCVDLSHHPNIVGLKDSGGDIPKLGLIIEQVNRNHQDFSVIAGSAGFLLDALKVGCSGGICALANVLGEQLIKVYDLFKQNDLKNAQLLQNKLIEPNKIVTRLFGIPALKASLDAYGYYGGPCRVPLLPLDLKEREIVKNTFLKHGFSWNS